jgi:protein-L-isoaspartate(D-aspartate) O-methyltransferase
MMEPGRFRILGVAGALLLTSAATASADQPPDEYAAERADMIRAIRRDVEDTADHIGRGQLDPRVLAAIERVPRHEFVPESLRNAAYQNRPLPIGHSQTISQPYIVALMTELIDPQADDVILEIGTGSGYQAAVLAELVERVYSIEIIDPLGREARQRFQRLGYANIETKIADGYDGWPEHGPFDAIVVTAAASHIPPPLVRQLAPGGIMVIPVGGAFQVQQLTLVEKDRDGTVVTRQILPVRFVPLTGRH